MSEHRYELGDGWANLAWAVGLCWIIASIVSCEMESRRMQHIEDTWERQDAARPIKEQSNESKD